MISWSVNERVAAEGKSHVALAESLACLADRKQGGEP
jgi:hypothetical protein